MTQGANQVEALTVDVKDLAETIDSTLKKTKNRIKIGTEVGGLYEVRNMIGKLDGMLQDLKSAYRGHLFYDHSSFQKNDINAIFFGIQIPSSGQEVFSDPYNLRLSIKRTFIYQKNFPSFFQGGKAQ